MRLIASFVAVGYLTVPAVAFQARPGGAPATPRISACALITPELAAKYNHKDIAKYLKPEEEPVGINGTHCEHGRIGLQVNPFARNSDLRKSPGKEWEPMSGIGDTAFFRANRSLFAELIVWTGAHHFTVQLGVPTGGTLESTKAEAIAIAHAIVPKLR